MLDYVNRGMFIENLTTTVANATLFGNWLDNSIIGGTGNDSIRGEAGNDSLFGGRGNDSLDGGANANFLDAGFIPPDPNFNTEIDWVTGGNPQLKNTDGIGYYRNITGPSGFGAYGARSYVVSDVIPAATALNNPRELNPQLTYFDVTLQKIQTLISLQWV